MDKQVEFYTSATFPLNDIVRIYKKYCDDLADPREIWIEGYDEFLFYRSDIELRKKELTPEQRQVVLACDKVVLEHAYAYLEEYEFGVGLLDDWYRDKHYPVSHWWWYVDKIDKGELTPPSISEASLL